jgi:hypothetical protein
MENMALAWHYTFGKVQPTANEISYLTLVIGAKPRAAAFIRQAARGI